MSTHTAALHRPFELGMLYDCRSDNLVLDAKLWNDDSIAKHIQRQQVQSDQPMIELEPSESDSISARAKALGVSSDLKVSVLAGIVPVSGVGSYLNHSQASDTARVTLKYKTRIHVKKLSMEILSNGDYSHPQVFENGNATHVVSGIEYGAEAFFVFDSKKMKLEELVAVVEELKAGTASNSQKTNKIKCTYHADIDLMVEPTSFVDAIAVLEQLPKLFEGNTPVPKRVHLFPLCKLDSRAAKLVHAIGKDAAKKVERVVQQSVYLCAHIAQLNKSPTVAAMPFLWKDLEKCRGVVDRSLTIFKKQLSPLLPTIRGGGVEKEQLDTMLSNWEESLVSPGNLLSVVTGIEGTLTSIKNICEGAKHDGVGESYGAALKPFIKSDQNIEFVVCFTLNTDILKSKGLAAICSAIQTETFLSSEPMPAEWHCDDQQNAMMKMFRLFLAYAKANKGLGRKIEYVVTDGKGLDSSEPVVVQRFDTTGHQIISLLSTPGKPYLTGETTASEVCIEWDCPSTKDINSLVGYVLWYQAADNSRENWWKSFQQQDAVTRCEVVSLEPGMAYIFKVQAITTAGVSPMSPASDPIVMKKLGDETRLANDILQQCCPCHDTNTEVSIYTPKQRIDRSQQQRVRKYEIGQSKPETTREKTILVVGATGTGKTTWLNSMFNYLTGVRLEDDFRFKLVTQEDEGEESALSRTKEVTGYILHHTILSYTLTVVDTPGYGDTEGLEADKGTTKLIKQLFEAGRNEGGIDQLDAVCLVVKSTDCRLTDDQRHNFNSVLALFSADMAENVIIIVTFCDDSTPPVILALKEGNVPCKSVFKFNNSAFFQAQKTDKFGKKAQEFYWDVGQNSFEAFFEGLEKMQPKSLTLAVEVLNKREEIENLVVHLHRQVEAGFNDLEQMRQEGMVMEEYEAKIKANENFTYTVTEQQVRQRDISGQGIHTTTCMVCNNTCHDNCKIEANENKAHCIAMKDGSCMACPKKCPWNLHKNLPYICEVVTVKVVKTDEDLRQKYADSKVDFDKTDKLLGNLGIQFGDKEMDIFNTIKNINQSLDTLKQIAMRPDHLTNVEYIERLIESEQAHKKPGWKNRVCYLTDQRNLAQKLQQVKDPNFDPFLPYRKEKGGWVRFAKKKVKSLSKSIGKMFLSTVPCPETAGGSTVLSVLDAAGEFGCVLSLDDWHLQESS